MAMAKRIQSVAPSPTLAVEGQVRALKAQGVRIVSFAAGEPDFDTPDHIKQAAVNALKAGFTKYPLPVAGIPELRIAISQKLKRENGLTYSAENISVAVGGKNALYTLMQVLIDPGDEVVIPAPYWVSYPEMVRLAEGKPVFIDAAENRGFKLTATGLERAITPHTKLVVLNSPSNPTGAVYTASELGELARVIVARNTWVVSDEIYEALVYDDVQHVSIASIGPDIKARTIVVNALSKAYAMTGWRVGYLAGPPEIINAVNRLQSHATSGPTSFVQKAAAAALNGPQDSVKQMRDEFDRRRKYIVERLKALTGMTCHIPRGAFYVFPGIAGWIGRQLSGQAIRGSVDFAQVCLQKAHVALVPGIAFGSDAHVRLSYATSMEQIKEGMDRLQKLLG